MPNDRNRPTQLTRHELMGFVELLSSSGELPQPTYEIMAYLERLAGKNRLDASAALQLAQRTVRSIAVARLREAHVEPVRPFDAHLKAKRSAANCTTSTVALLLGVEERQYQRLEAGERNPLDESPTLLASIVAAFGLQIGELRHSLIAYFQRGKPTIELGFARGVSDKLSKDDVLVAAEDLRNHGAKKAPLEKQVLDRIELKLAEIQLTLQK